MAIASTAACSLSARPRAAQRVQAPRSRVVASAAPEFGPDRRQTLGLLAAGAAGLALPLDAYAANTKSVQAYMPVYPEDPAFNLFIPNKQKTPGIRAAAVDPDAPYQFAIPGAWHEDPVANIQSGNYCQPRCVEPWTEVLFSDAKEGKLQVIVSPLQRLTRKKNQTIEQVGTPEGVLTSIGAFITGTYLDTDDVISISTDVRDDGLTYYNYEIFADYGTVGPHTLTTLTVKGELALMVICSADEKQWRNSESKLRTVQSSFRASVPRA